MEYLPSVTDLSTPWWPPSQGGIRRRAARRTPSTGEDAESAARKAEIRDQTRKFTVGVLFACPSFSLSMGGTFGLLGPGATRPGSTGCSWLLATPVQFYTGWDYYVGGFKSLRNRSANMDVLVAMGSSVAYFYSACRAAASRPLGDHVYFETSAVIITLIKLGKMLEARTKGRTGGGHPQADGPAPEDRRASSADGAEVEVPIDQVTGGRRRCWCVPASGSRWTAWSSRATRPWTSPC